MSTAFIKHYLCYVNEGVPANPRRPEHMTLALKVQYEMCLLQIPTPVLCLCSRKGASMSLSGFWKEEKKFCSEL